MGVQMDNMEGLGHGMRKAAHTEVHLVYSAGRPLVTSGA